MIDVSGFIDWARGESWNSPKSKYYFPICDKDIKENAMTMKEKYAIPSIKKVIYNPPATIVYWCDGTKTVVKCCEADIYDTEKGFAMAVIKKLCGNEPAPFHKLFKTWAADDKIATTDNVSDIPLPGAALFGTMDELKEKINRAFGIGGIDGD